MKLSGAPRSMKVSPEGTRLAFGDYDGTVRVMSLTSGRLLWKLRPGEGQRVDRAVDFLAWSPDGKSIGWSSNRRLYVASTLDGSLRWERPAAQRRYASVPIAWRPNGNGIFWMSDEALHEVSASDGGPLGDALFPHAGDGAISLTADAASALVVGRAMGSSAWIVVDTDARRTVAQIETDGRRAHGMGSYAGFGVFVGAARFAVFHWTSGRYLFDAATGACVLHRPHTPDGARAFTMGEGGDGASPWVVHPAPVVNREIGLPRDASLVAWNAAEDRSVALDARAQDGLYAVVPGQRAVLYDAPPGRGELQTCVW